MQSIRSTCVPLGTTTTTTTTSTSARYTLVGRSRAGDGTTFVIPQLRWMFDCGALVEGGGLRQPQVIFLTHTHADHIFTLAHFTHRRELEESYQKNGPLQIYLPATALAMVRSYLIAYEAMITMGEKSTSSSDGIVQKQKQPEQEQEQEREDQHLLLYELIGVTPGQEIPVHSAGGKEFLVRVVECVHRVDCVGYSIWEKNRKLKEEYIGMKGKEIGLLRREGVDIYNHVLQPIVCYLGDTTAQVFDNHPEILEEHSVIVVECSFIDADSVETAKRTKHMHWNDLKTHVECHPQTLFILTHFSLKYSVLSIINFFNEQTTNNLHPMLVQLELQEEWNRRQKHQNDDGNRSEDKDEQKNDSGPPPCPCFVCQPP